MSETMTRWRAVYATGPEVLFDATEADVSAFHERLRNVPAYSRNWYAIGAVGLDTSGLRSVVPVTTIPTWQVRGNTVKSQVESVMERTGRPMRIADIAEAIPESNYYTIRTILHRGEKAGDYTRTGHKYSLATAPNDDAPDESAHLADGAAGGGA